MSSVTFPASVGGDGSTVSDDTDPSTGLRNGGYLTRFVPALGNMVAIAGNTVTQATNAAASATSASGSATAAASSASSASASFLSMDKKWLGAKASNPTVDNQGAVLATGAAYFNTTAAETRVYNGTSWVSAAVVGGTVASLRVTGNFSYGGTMTGALNTDVAGNAGLGVTPSAWGSSFKAFDIGATASFISGFGGFGVSANSYNDGANWLYKNTDFANLYLSNNGQHQWYTAPSGTAGNPITFNQAMTLFNSGNLAIGATSDTVFKLNTNGAGVFLTNTSAGAGLCVTDTAGASTASTYGRLSTNGTNFAIGQNAYTIPGSWLKIDNSLPSAVLQFGSNGVSFNASDAGSTTPLQRTIFSVNNNGFFRTSNTGNYDTTFTGGDVPTSFHFKSDQSTQTLLVTNTSTAAGVETFTSDLVSGATGYHFIGALGGTRTFAVAANGDVQNTNNSYGAISDAKLKNVIGPKASTWDKTKAYEWVEYYLKSDVDQQNKLLGLVAQDAELVSPGVVFDTPDMEEVEVSEDVTKEVQATETQTVDQVNVDYQLIDGKWTRVETTEPVEVQIPLFDEFPLFDEAGEPIMEKVGDEYVQATQKIPRMVTVTETQTRKEMQPTGTTTKGVKYSVVGMEYHRTVQEAQLRIEALEAQAADFENRIAALEAA